MNAAKLTFLVVCLLVAGCSDERAAGGTAETENAVSARVYRVDSLFHERLDSTIPTVATVRLDSGNFDFAHVDLSGRDLDVRKPDGTPVPFEIAYWDPASRHGRLRVRIGKDLLVAGSRISVWSGLPRTNRTNSVGVWDAIPDSQKTELTSVLVDDFERGSLKTPLPDSSTWFVLAGSGNGNALAGAERSGRALHVVSTSTSTTPVALAAALLASTPRSLRSVDSIVFWARGQGRARVAVEYAMAGTQIVSWCPISIDTSWRRVRVLPGTFDTSASDGARWSEVRDIATHLSFWMVGGGELWIDDPRIYGIDRDDLR